jgi:hypothetical protein
VVLYTAFARAPASTSPLRAPVLYDEVRPPFSELTMSKFLDFKLPLLCLLNKHWTRSGFYEDAIMGITGIQHNSLHQHFPKWYKIEMISPLICIMTGSMRVRTTVN